MPTPPNPGIQFLLIGYAHGWRLSTLDIKAITDVPCHLIIRYSLKPLRMHDLTKLHRGLPYIANPYYCFTEWFELEQDQPGDTLHHIFHIPSFEPGQERAFYFRGTVGGVLSPSITAAFQVKYHEESQMITIGIYGEAETLEGEVKLEQGDGITLTRDDAHNSIKITADITQQPALVKIKETSLLIDSPFIEILGIPFTYDYLFLLGILSSTVVGVLKAGYNNYIGPGYNYEYHFGWDAVDGANFGRAAAFHYAGYLSDIPDFGHFHAWLTNRDSLDHSIHTTCAHGGPDATTNYLTSTHCQLRLAAPARISSIRLTVPPGEIRAGSKLAVYGMQF